MTTNHLNFTVFSDETGSITNSKSEIFGGSLFIIEDSEIRQCRKFLKENYQNGIHCKDISYNSLLKISQAVSVFLKNKNCCAITSIQINKNLMKEEKCFIESRYPYIPTGKDLSLLKRYYYYYVGIPRYALLSMFNLIKNSDTKKIKVSIFIENFIRDKYWDNWNIHLERFNNSLELYKSYFKHDKKKIAIIDNIEIIKPYNKTKNEEVMFSFPDLFAYCIRRIVTHKEYGIYNNLKHIFDKFPYGNKYFQSHFFKTSPKGVFFEYVTAEELHRLSDLDEKEWQEELKRDLDI